MQCKTDKIWLHSCKLLRRIAGGGSDEELALLRDGVAKFASFDKLWMMLLQCMEHRNEDQECIAIANRALQRCSDSIPLWLEYVRILAHKLGKYGKARSVLQSATLQHPECEDLHLASAKLELFENRKKNEQIYRNDAGYQQCKSLIAKGLQQCPQSGKLCAFEIEIEPVASKKGKCVQAIKKCPNDVFVFVEVAKYFVQIRKMKRAKEWFERAVIANPLHGDAWAYFYWFCCSNGKNETECNAVLERACAANPKYGDLWLAVSKKIGNEGMNKRDILLNVIEQHIKPFDGFPIKVI